MNHPQTISLLAEVIAQHPEQRCMQVRPITRCEEITKINGCCGGYCGNQLWQKLFIPNKSLLVTNTQRFGLGEQVIITLPWRYSIIFQASLWLLNSLIFIVLLSVLPNTLMSLLLALIGTAIAFVSIFKTLRFFRLTPLSFINVHYTNKNQI